MKSDYKGWTIECIPNSSWDGRFKGRTLSIYRPIKTDKGQRANEFLFSGWFDGLVKDGVKEGKRMVDKKVST